MKYCYSSYEEGNYYGEFDTPEEAALEDLYGNEKSYTYVGELREKTAHQFVYAENILDSIVDSAYDAGDFVDGWLCSVLKNKDKLNELEKLIGDWIQENGPPKWFTVENIRMVTREELEEKGLLERKIEHNLKDQIEAARKSISEYPEWMKKVNHFAYARIKDDQD